IPVAAVVDSNSNPDRIDFPIPGNDDAMRAIQLYCDLFAGAVLDGLQQEMTTSGIDVGEAEAPPPEDLAAVAQASTEDAAPVEPVAAAAEPAAEVAAETVAAADPAPAAEAETPAPESA
ncbi:MAG: 30S ribosomal protein S2, partial [Alphaproteobacteria bacterium]|nr:30S ribosomal protein S2 [Alphaproteobacteria bacterium]